MLKHRALLCVGFDLYAGLTPKVSVSEGLGWGLSTSVSNKIPGDAAAAPGAPL